MRLLSIVMPFVSSQARFSQTMRMTFAGLLLAGSVQILSADIVITPTAPSKSLDNVTFGPNGPAAYSQTGEIGSKSGFFLTATSDLQITSKGSNSLIPDLGPSLGSTMTLTPTNFLGFGTISLNYDACHLNSLLPDVQVTVESLNSGTVVQQLNWEGSQPQRILIHATMGEIIDKIIIEPINGVEIQGAKQIRVDSSTIAVPEPSSFLACSLILGLTAIGHRLRRRFRS